MSLSKHFGFSLIELMIVVAIIGILSAIAIPSYQVYTRKARFSEIIAATEPYKTAISLALQEGIPASELDNNKHGIPALAIATRNLESIQVERGIITARASKLIDNITYILKPDSDGSHWSVDGGCVAAGLCES